MFTSPKLVSDRVVHLNIISLESSFYSLKPRILRLTIKLTDIKVHPKCQSNIIPITYYGYPLHITAFFLLFWKHTDHFRLHCGWLWRQLNPPIRWEKGVDTVLVPGQSKFRRYTLDGCMMKIVSMIYSDTVWKLYKHHFLSGVRADLIEQEWMPHGMHCSWELEYPFFMSQPFNIWPRYFLAPPSAELVTVCIVD